MSGRSLLLAAVALALLLPATAAAKGASEATITGPGLDSLTLRGEGGMELGSLADHAGLYPSLFGQSPDPMLPGRPSGNLGPKYTITWVVPGPDRVDRVRQYLYPYAAGGPVTYMPSGQRVFNDRSRGGWYRASIGLRDQLVAAGLPARAPSTSKSGHALAFTFGGLGAAALLLAGGALAVRRRRS
jgi:MYXO-CTERM domain-containing protein